MPSITIGPKIFAGSLIILFLLLGGVYFYQEISQFSATPTLVLASPLDNSVVKEDKVDFTGEVEAGSRVYLNGQGVEVSTNGSFNQKINLHQGVNELEVKAVNRFGTELVRKIKIRAEQDSEEEVAANF